MTDIPPVITIDGPSGVGKGTAAQKLAKHLGWHYLDSGAIYRVFAWAVLRDQIDPEDMPALKELLKTINIVMNVEQDQLQILCDGEDISQAIRNEEVGSMASRLSTLPLVRAELLQMQRDFQQFPGLVTDGRDMGTVVFPEARLKLFFTADQEERARRRYHQLQEKGENVNLHKILAQLAERDQRDTERTIAPLKPADDVVLIDTTSMSIDDVMQTLIDKVASEFGDTV